MQDFNPTDYNIPDDFQHYPGDPAEDSLGPFFYRQAGDQLEAALSVQARHCNIMGGTHGGILMTMADYCLATPLFLDHPAGVLTVSCNCDFVGASQEGDLIIGRAEITRRGKSLAFTRCTLSVDKRTILTANGVIKPLQQR
ncbi:PaaI family thioesterase [Pseudomaricurvus alkylphenolicus]|uniref:PaaI family thioesterase n=1 Tax=Pseudomaricurvus alkylphenolicus TaxID=1306991 RepID=UPI001420D51E|nr:PaaI family thioesterase [Pseudomaricurvus alkylphenolicus]NIB45088.1 PaaI family thioesterase [Pseudomaricurvus alkylphenolicus]